MVGLKLQETDMRGIKKVESRTRRSGYVRKTIEKDLNGGRRSAAQNVQVSGA